MFVNLKQAILILNVYVFFYSLCFPINFYIYTQEIYGDFDQV